MGPRFGLEELQAGWRVEGDLTISQILHLGAQLIKLVGMTKDGLPIIDSYPKGGKGGMGIQVYQPLYESWLVISTWPLHNFIRVNLSSCKTFDPDKVAKYLEENVGKVQASWSNPL